MLTIKNVSKKFGKIVALDRVNLRVGSDECLGIIGPNGAGKTTLFNVVSGFLKPDSGRIEFRGECIQGKKPNCLVKKGLVRTFQLIRVFKNMTVEENILAPNSRGADEILDIIELKEKRNMLAKNLSQGELRRLSIGIALAAHPKMLLLDEPFSGLGPKEALKLDSVIKELKEDGIPQIIIEHKLKELFKLSERVVVLNFGKIIFDGHPEEAIRDKAVINAYLGANHVEN
ncbi:MAG TPA: ABC transporter ATP-binding protein [Archaeoglobaceae archaeon]|nr:ABC transporter ATP-binding protein [Archaeoglobaceae archaeon]